MRTTLTLDDDVAVAVDRLRRQANQSLKEVINGLLRSALAERKPRQIPRTPYRTPSHPSGRCLVGSLDDVATALAIAEGENHR